MAILTYKCPHCVTDHVALQVVAATRGPNATPLIAHLQRPKCLLPVAASLMPAQGRGPNSDLHAIMQFHGDIREFGWAINEFWPEAPSPLIPELLPPDVERVYLQAERNFPTVGNEEAAGIMYGKALDIGLKKIDPSLSGMLSPRIKKLADAGKLTSDIAEWSDHIRDIRNDATHEEDPITKEQLADLRHFTEMVLRYLFSLPNQVRKRRGEKLPWEP
jgi:uncharacterized protein DUF4145